MIVVSYGGGTNSTAMLVGLHERGERPDAIVFADPGSEYPHTYDHIGAMRGWLYLVGFPQIQIVSAPITLEADCLKRKALPSIAYGFKTCSQRFKRQPFEKWCKAEFPNGYTRLIGIDAGEPHRAKPYEGTRYPLIEWDWDRADCEAAILRAGLPRAGKSSCTFCPAHTKPQINLLATKWPEHFKRALAIEDNAELTNVRGLGRAFSWREFVYGHPDQFRLFTEIEAPCDCYDGEAA